MIKKDEFLSSHCLHSSGGGHKINKLNMCMSNHDNVGKMEREGKGLVAILNTVIKKSLN